MPAWFPTADTWEAWGTWATALVAIGAAVFAYQQVSEARRTRERVAQPEVIVFLDHHKVRRYVDFVIKNFGQTTAYNIQITLPPLDVARYVNQSTGKEVRHLLRPDKIAVLAPGQEWRTVWDSVVRRQNFEGELTDQYGGHVTFDDKVSGKDRRTYCNPIALDIKMFWNTMWIEQRKGRSVENALYDISETLQGYTKEHEGVWVYTVPGGDERAHRERIDNDPEYAFDSFMDAVEDEKNEGLG